MKMNMPKHIPPGSAELSVYIDKQLKTSFKLTCVAQNKSMSEIVGKLIKEWVKSQSEQQTLAKEEEDKGVA